VPFDRRVLTDIHVPSGQWSLAEPGDMVVVEITRWPTATRGPHRLECRRELQS
jgi:exoribonuclease R